MVELKSNIADQKSDERMNVLLFVLSCFEGCSISLAGILCILGWLMPDTAPRYPFIEGFTSVLWVILFFSSALLFFLTISGKIVRRKKKRAKRERKKEN